MAAVADRVTRFLTGGGIRIYRIAVETFPGLVNNLYLILDGPHSTLFDVGSGAAPSNEALEAAFEEVRARFGEAVDLTRVGHVVISHGHIDHFGHVGFFVRETGSVVYVHELDARVVEQFEERVTAAAGDLARFLAHAGVEPRTRRGLEQLYRSTKEFFRSVPCHVRLRDGDRIVNGYVVHHVPGHCPGQICLQVDDVLLTADHVLARITPHQSPGWITPYCGLDLYLDGLARVARLPGVALALAGHEAEIETLAARADEIAAHHAERCARVLDLCREPRTVAAISRELFGVQSSYGLILALEEAGAHVEYLAARGELVLANGAAPRGDDGVAGLWEVRRGSARATCSTADGPIR